MYFTRSNFFFNMPLLYQNRKSFESVPSLSVNGTTVGDNNIEIMLYYDVTVCLMFTVHNNI